MSCRHVSCLYHERKTPIVFQPDCISKSEGNNFLWLSAGPSLTVSVLLCYKLFCMSLLVSIYSNNPIILGENNQNLPLLVKIIAEALHHEVMDSDESVKNRVLTFLKQIIVSTRPLFSLFFSSKVRSNLDISNSDISNSAKL